MVPGPGRTWLYRQRRPSATGCHRIHQTPAKPSGYLVSEPGSADATLLLSDLPPVPEGGQQFVIASNADGITQQYQIAGNGMAVGNSFIRPTSINAAVSIDSLTLSSLSLSGGFTNFKVVQTAVDRSTPTVILTSGQP